MIDTAEQTTTTCQACGQPLTQKHGRGHRQRLYCDDRCRQRGHRQQAQVQEQESLDATNFKRLEQYAMDCSLDAWSSKSRITQLEIELAELEARLKELQERLDIETRFRTDTDVRHFKKWLRTHDQPRDSDFAKRFLADTRLPQHASRSRYAAFLRLYRYSDEDIFLFEETWKDMLFLQS